MYIFVVFYAKSEYRIIRLIFRKGINMSNPIDTKVISKLAEILDKNQLTTLNY